MSYQAPVRDYQFLIENVFKTDQYNNLKGFADADSATVMAILEEAAKFTEEVVHPINITGDKEGCVLNADGRVTAPKGYKEAYKALTEAGWTALSNDPEYGGQGLPHFVNTAFSEMLSGASSAFGMYPGLTEGAISALHAGGTDEQKALYLPKLISGEWSGTMNLTEPHCGTDLGLLRTKAVPNGDGSYRISGQKIWISAGEHDFTSNICHLVLARIEGAPAGVKGISLFLVPKFLPDADGNPGERNSLKCAGLEHKMGIHGNSTCVMVYEEAKGFLLGSEHEGLKIMFYMMNSARYGVGLQGLAIGHAAYVAATQFAKDRLQGRALTGPKSPDKPADSILVHPDVRRMLLESRALIEGGRAFLMWGALQADFQHVAEDEKAREKASDYMGLLTPVIKAYLTEKGLKVTQDAMQVHGGSGFTEHFPASQYMRDVRITLIYEGTNGVQALDLVGRKLPSKGGRALQTFFGEIDAYVAAEESGSIVPAYIKALKDTKAKLMDGTMWLMQNGMGNPDNAAAGSLDYLHLFGLTCSAYMWAMMAKAAQEEINNGSTDPFFATKLKVGRVFLERILPDADAHLAKMKAGAEALMALEDELF
ncbi:MULTISPECIES: acyl-CoA dehydrogenase C-terminal domain-containing protein [Asticcacaulis]|uniref:acyl-CoA dehydrogenase C-terminal domain-containing protein n=1 Tax=Asticcacaulis TaxID=76890 RepID=UPI001AE69081|nr:MULTISPECIES: acyl-CoA dehydrogenase C-terminal domain-containing protein [Asticcacaulis]MBP2158944.1 alkylation response protein AidB-like acyl-CoA dehydrogenase [Asticcacaulis solisilvae]MDR6799989.1 alkylation response protein AidB-like acyl-CoA dehydrogenase [Asticcacaulis sp. BE141]